MNKKMFAIALALIASFATAGATVYVIDSNTAHVTWTLSCSSQPVCVFFGTLSGNATYATYSVRILATKSVSNQYINTTIFSGPPNISYNLNGTTGTQWLFGPYSFSPNRFYPFSFALKYNGTAGSYDFAVNVVQAQ